eukprot:Gregarina_sp_Poly_1__3289@NODE_1943_length_3030_cov_28_657779_g1252_i0_p1_GENE_NODE_1943_length_3030_cov_28_657779_g1252_i0NODE_1943_length_3030_cov_28_657779_g1252_i0_p1_ORF_typecomplete_len405_score30_04PNISR/PF15996_5/0_16_NODE_1943_length_3030_cov_28_657779_g1252_i014432657
MKPFRHSSRFHNILHHPFAISARKFNFTPQTLLFVSLPVVCSVKLMADKKRATGTNSQRAKHPQHFVCCIQCPLSESTYCHPRHNFLYLHQKNESLHRIRHPVSQFYKLSGFVTSYPAAKSVYSVSRMQSDRCYRHSSTSDTCAVLGRNIRGYAGNHSILSSHPIQQWARMVHSESINYRMDTDEESGFNWDPESEETQAKFARATFAVQTAYINVAYAMTTLHSLKDHARKCFPSNRERSLHLRFEKFLEATFAEWNEDDYDSDSSASSASASASASDPGSYSDSDSIEIERRDDTLVMIRRIMTPFVKDIGRLLRMPKAKKIAEELIKIVSKIETPSELHMKCDNLLEMITPEFAGSGLTYTKNELLTVFKLATGISEFGLETCNYYNLENITTRLNSVHTS